MRAPAASTLVAIAIGLGLVAWNGSRFVNAQAKIRTKDLSFLPSPTMARVLCLGHENSFAKLRWIDSFAYFEKQLDAKDDTVAATGESTFERLYRMLIALDPKFLPYYQHASLNLGGALGRHSIALGIMEGGLLEIPHETQLWRLIAAELSAQYKAETMNAAAMDGLLAAWYDAETTDEGRRAVWDWKKSMAQRRYQELEQLPYWLEQLRRAAPGSPTREFVLRTIREQIARFGESRLQLLVDEYRQTRMIPPITMNDVLAPDIVAKVFPRGLPPLGPVRRIHEAFVLKSDPFGYPYQLVAGKPLSPGWQQVHEGLRAGLMGMRLADVAKKTGHWPTTVAEAIAAGMNFDALPHGGVWGIDGQVVTITWSPPPAAPWEP